MGYTHYWHLNNKGNEKRYAKAKENIIKIIKSKQDILANGLGESNTLSEIRDEISFNGIQPDDYETFHLPNTLSDLHQPNYADKDKGPWVLNFCKTGRTDYDIVVVACLTVLKSYLKEDVKIESDGRYDELNDGHKLAEEILGKRLTHPLNHLLPNSIQYILEEEEELN
jgi:hypothetical protein